MQGGLYEGEMRKNGNQRKMMGKKREKMKVIFEWEKGENDDFAAVSSHEISRISEYKMGTEMKILDRGMRPSGFFKSQHFLVIKFVL